MTAKLLAALTLLLLALAPAGAAAKRSDRNPVAVPVPVAQAPAASDPGVVDPALAAEEGLAALGVEPPDLPGRPPGDPTLPPVTDPPTPPPANPGPGRGKAVGRRCRGLSHRRAAGQRQSPFKRCVELLKQRAAKIKEQQAEDEAAAEAETPEAGTWPEASDSEE